MIRTWFFVLPVLFIHLVLLINTRFTLWPEMVVYPYLLNNGFVLYRDIINPYMPLFTEFLSIFTKYLGYSPSPYKVFTWGLILTIDLLIFLIASRTTNKKNAFLSLVIFVLLSLPFGINGLWFDLAQTPFIILAFYFFLKYFYTKNKNNNLLKSSIFIAIAFAIKQQVLWLYIWFLVVLVFKNFSSEKNRLMPDFLKLIAPFVLLIILLSTVYSKNGILADFLFWTFYFPFVKAANLPGYVSLPTSRQILIVLSLLAIIIFPSFFKSKKSLVETGSGFLLILFAYPRFDYFHLIPALAIFSLSMRENFYYFIKKGTITRILLSLIILELSVFTAKYFFKNTVSQVRFFEPEILQSANFLRSVTYDNQEIYILNGPDQLYPLSQTSPVKPWADEFPWYLENSYLQQKVVNELKLKKPQFVIYKPYVEGGKYELGSYKPQLIAGYIENNYTNSVQISDTLWLKKKK